MRKSIAPPKKFVQFFVAVGVPPAMHKIAAMMPAIWIVTLQELELFERGKGPTSGPGQSRRLYDVRVIFAFPPVAAAARTSREVRFVPEAVMEALFDHLSGET